MQKLTRSLLAIGGLAGLVACGVPTETPDLAKQEQTNELVIGSPRANVASEISLVISVQLAPLHQSIATSAPVGATDIAGATLLSVEILDTRWQTSGLSPPARVLTIDANKKMRSSARNTMSANSATTASAHAATTALATIIEDGASVADPRSAASRRYAAPTDQS